MTTEFLGCPTPTENSEPLAAVTFMDDTKTAHEILTSLGLKPADGTEQGTPIPDSAAGFEPEMGLAHPAGEYAGFNPSSTPELDHQMLLKALMRSDSQSGQNAAVNPVGSTTIDLGQVCLEMNPNLLLKRGDESNPAQGLIDTWAALIGASINLSAKVSDAWMVFGQTGSSGDGTFEVGYVPAGDEDVKYIHFRAC
jgi:hypothetical protein